jgi:hypothetical protein
MKYLVGDFGGVVSLEAWPRAGQRADSHTPTPCKSLKKLPGFAGNTNVITVTEKGGMRAA